MTPNESVTAMLDTITSATHPTVFDQLQPAPPDPILGLSEAFAKDLHPHKINLSVGVFQDEHGRTPILRSVKQAEELILRGETSKEYLGIAGSPKYAAAVQELLFGSGHEALASGRAATAQTPGGTGALRVAADFLHAKFPGRKVWLSNPTWPNHPALFQAAGLETAVYPYFDAATNSLAVERMLAAIHQMSSGDVLVLHACCHNPTGVDPTLDQWSRIADAVAERRLLPLVDFAYQGFGDGIRQDAAGLLALARPGCELLVCSSFSKNFGLYNERVGAMTLVAADRTATDAAFSHVKQAIRTNYSNPPAHGGAVVAAVLTDPALRRQWESEVAAMRTRIHDMRQRFVAALTAAGIDRDFSFINRQRGMFSFSGLTHEQVERLRRDDAIYIVGSGRINVAGITPNNLDRLAAAIARVIKSQP